MKTMAATWPGIAARIGFAWAIATGGCGGHKGSRTDGSGISPSDGATAQPDLALGNGGSSGAGGVSGAGGAEAIDAPSSPGGVGGSPNTGGTAIASGGIGGEGATSGTGGVARGGGGPGNGGAGGIGGEGATSETGGVARGGGGPGNGGAGGISGQGATSGTGGVAGGGGRPGNGGAGGSPGVDANATLCGDGGGADAGDVPCGNQGLICSGDQVCIEGTWYPNNLDPNNILPATTSWSCQPNPCGCAPVSCDCGRSACGMFFSTCYALASARKLNCAFYASCASPETRIATPAGERHIADLIPGDLVYSSDGQVLRPVPILRVNKTAVTGHHVVEVRTADGAVLEISAGHPTADGRLFGELRAGDLLDGVLIVSSRMIAYRFSHTYDILPASDTGTYVASGRLIGSTMK